MQHLSILFLLQQVLLIAAANWDCADYYWRDYHGTIFNDAIPAGNDSNGDPVYVGLVYIQGFELLPATIYPKQRTATTTAYAHVLNTSQHVKILCGPFKEPFEWISTHSTNLKDYVNQNLIPGGSEVGESLYIGRVFRDNGVIIGKIFRDELSNKGIWFPLGNGPQNSLTYEVLRYNCDKVPELFQFETRSKIDKKEETNKT